MEKAFFIKIKGRGKPYISKFLINKNYEVYGLEFIVSQKYYNKNISILGQI